MRGRQLKSLLINGARLGHITVGKVFLDGERIDIAPQSRVAGQDFELGAEDELTVVEQRIVERLYAEAVACQEQRFLIAIPQREREHATEALDTGFAPLFPGMHDDFSIAARAEGMAQRLQLGNQIDEVINFAVEHHHHTAVLVEQRLVAGRKIDDGQPLVRQPYTGFRMQAGFIRAAMMLGLIHARQQRLVDFALGLRVEDAGYATHG